MSILVIRHGLSEANNRENYGTPAFGALNAPLMELGEQQAVQAGEQLVARYGVDVASTPVAVSMLRRTQETAIAAGFRQLSLYSQLNEVEHGLDDTMLRQHLDAGIAPTAALFAADKVLDNPPSEGIWVTHALLIAALCRQLNIYEDRRFIPKFCEIRELPIS